MFNHSEKSEPQGASLYNDTDDKSHEVWSDQQRKRYPAT